MLYIFRDVKASDELIQSAMEDLERLGFLNYFGLQRFGTTSVNTHSVGLALLKSEWKEAAMLILKPRAGGTELKMAASRTHHPL